MHALPLGTPLVWKFLRAEERRPSGGSICLSHSLYGLSWWVPGDLSSFNLF